jgi:hypothetical protein
LFLVYEKSTLKITEMECEKSGLFEKYLDSIILWNFPQFYFHV